MTKDTAKKLIKIYPLLKRSAAEKDIDEKAFEEITIVPVFELDGNCYQFTADYKIKLSDGYIYGRAMSLEEFSNLHRAASEGKKFKILYLKNARLILELEEIN